MAVYKCSVCGAIYDEEKSGKPISELTECPVCKQPVSKFVLVSEEKKQEETKRRYYVFRVFQGTIVLLFALRRKSVQSYNIFLICARENVVKHIFTS